MRGGELICLWKEKWVEVLTCQASFLWAVWWPGQPQEWAMCQLHSWLGTGAKGKMQLMHCSPIDQLQEFGAQALGHRAEGRGFRSGPPLQFITGAKVTPQPVCHSAAPPPRRPICCTVHHWCILAVVKAGVGQCLIFATCTILGTMFSSCLGHWGGSRHCP